MISLGLGPSYPAFYSAPPFGGATGPPVFITPGPLPPVMPGDPYFALIPVEQGTPPYRFGVISGVLPPGLTMSIDGQITGTAPVVATIEPATLPPACVDQQYPYTLTVADLLYPFTVRVVDSVGQYDEEDYVLALWEGPTSFSLDAGKLPPCMGFGGGFSGVPIRVGTFPITVRATDRMGRTVTRSYDFTVIPCGGPDG